MRYATTNKGLDTPKQRRTYDGRHERRLDFAQQQFFPRNLTEEGLLFHIFGVALRRAEAAFGVFA